MSPRTPVTIIDSEYSMTRVCVDAPIMNGGCVADVDPAIISLRVKKETIGESPRRRMSRDSDQVHGAVTRTSGHVRHRGGAVRTLSHFHRSAFVAAAACGKVAKHGGAARYPSISGSAMSWSAGLEPCPSAGAGPQCIDQIAGILFAPTITSR